MKKTKTKKTTKKPRVVVVAEKATASIHRHAGPECVQIFMEAPALCPVHGKVKTYDTDVMD